VAPRDQRNQRLPPVRAADRATMVMDLLCTAGSRACRYQILYMETDDSMVHKVAIADPLKARRRCRCCRGCRRS
jgi:hypothetical protein